MGAQFTVSKAVAREQLRLSSHFTAFLLDANYLTDCSFPCGFRPFHPFPRLGSLTFHPHLKTAMSPHSSPPASVSPTRTQRAPPSRQTPVSAGAKSVKAIVAWLETASPIASLHTPRSASATDLNPDLSSSSMTTIDEIRRYHASTPANEIEEYSLTYLRYQSYFASTPLQSLLDSRHRLPATEAQVSRQEPEDEKFTFIQRDAQEVKAF